MVCVEGKGGYRMSNKKKSFYPHHHMGMDLARDKDVGIYHSYFQFNDVDLCKNTEDTIIRTMECKFAEMYEIVLKEFYLKTELCRRLKCKDYNLSHCIESTSGSHEINVKTNLCQHFGERTCRYYFEKLVLEQEENVTHMIYGG